MIAAAYPSLNTAVLAGTTIGLVAACIVALIVGGAADIHDWRPARTAAAVGTAVTITLAIAAAITALAHHAAWVDYRRSLG